MAYEEYTVEKNTGYVPLAQKDTPEGVLQDIERRALAEVTSAEKTSNKGEQAQKAAAGVSGTEGKVYADMAMEAAGFKSVSTLVSAVGARLNDTSSIQGVTENTATASRHIDDDVKSAGRAPGSYRNPHEARGYGIQQVAGGSDLSNMSLGDRAGLTSASLRAEEGTGNLNTWAQKPFENAKVGSLDGQVKALELQNNAKLSQDVTFTKEAASEAALTSVKLARDHQSQLRGPQGPGMGMGGPGMGGLNFDLSQGPRFNHAQYEESAGEKLVMVAAVDRLPTAELFMANLNEVTQPKVEEAPVAINLRNAFEGVTLTGKVDGPAANVNAAPNALTAAAALAGGASVMPEDQKQGLASGAVLAGESMRAMEGFDVGKGASDALQLGAQAAKLGMEAGKEAMKLGGEAIQAISNVFSLGDRNSDGIPDSQQNLAQMEEPKMRPAQVSFQSMPSPSGMGG